MSKDRCRPDDRSLWEDAPYDLLRSSLCTEELRLRVLVRIVRGYMHEPVHIILGDSFCNALSAFNMDILEVEIPIAVSSISSLGEDGLALSGNPSQRGCRLYQSVARFPQVTVYSAGRTPG